MLKALRDFVSGTDQAVEVGLTPERQKVTQPVKVARAESAVELDLGGKKLRLYREAPLRSGPEALGKDWILVDPDRYFSGIAGFARLECGQTLLVGRGNENLDRVFAFPKGVGRRHLQLANIDGAIVVRPLDSDRKTYLALVPDGQDANWLATRWTDNLKRLRTIYGGPIELLEPDLATATLKQVHAILTQEAYRPRNADELPGGLLDFPEEPTPIIVGDIHAQLDNLIKILSRDHYLDALERGDAYLLLLGDAVHREGDGELEEMDSSILTLDLLFRLKLHFPKNVFYLRGNHESFDSDVGKGGVPQGRLLWQRCRKLRGKSYTKQLAECFDLLAYIARSRDFLACHGGPPRQQTSFRNLVDIRHHPRLARQLIWNRLRRTGRPEGYAKRDVRALREVLGVKKDTPLIVSHTPLSRSDAIWTNAGEIPGHHIMFSANPKQIAVFIRSGREMIPLSYPGEPLLDFVNGL